jgi:CrcB protein
MIYKMLVLAAGGSLGTVFRFLVYTFFEKNYQSDFPWATFTVNTLGSFLIGFLWGYFSNHYLSPGLRMLVFVGFLGSFTTFSTFAFDNFSLLRDGEFRFMIIYLVMTNVVGIGLAIGGYFLSKQIA